MPPHHLTAHAPCPARLAIHQVAFTSIQALGICSSQHFIGMAALAINPVASRAYPHHPVLLEAAQGPYPFEGANLVELNGLRVPKMFDCQKWGVNNYKNDVPSRWHACNLHEAAAKSDLGVVHAVLPIIDDEYQELVAVYQSVLRSKPNATCVDCSAQQPTMDCSAHQSTKLARMSDTSPTSNDRCRDAIQVRCRRARRTVGHVGDTCSRNAEDDEGTATLAEPRGVGRVPCGEQPAALYGRAGGACVEPNAGCPSELRPRHTTRRALLGA